MGPPPPFLTSAVLKSTHLWQTWQTRLMADCQPQINGYHMDYLGGIPLIFRYTHTHIYIYMYIYIYIGVCVYVEA